MKHSRKLRSMQRNRGQVMDSLRDWQGGIGKRETREGVEDIGPIRSQPPGILQREVLAAVRGEPMLVVEDNYSYSEANIDDSEKYDPYYRDGVRWPSHGSPTYVENLVSIAMKALLYIDDGIEDGGYYYREADLIFRSARDKLKSTGYDIEPLWKAHAVLLKRLMNMYEGAGNGI
jgi:hypothetical protein